VPVGLGVGVGVEPPPPPPQATSAVTKMPRARVVAKRPREDMNFLMILSFLLVEIFGELVKLKASVFVKVLNRFKTLTKNTKPTSRIILFLIVFVNPLLDADLAD
jgi:hypothetical protein